LWWGWYSGIQNHIHKQANTFLLVLHASNYMKPNEFQIQHSYQPNENPCYSVFKGTCCVSHIRNRYLYVTDNTYNLKSRHVILSWIYLLIINAFIWNEMSAKPINPLNRFHDPLIIFTDPSLTARDLNEQYLYIIWWQKLFLLSSQMGWMECRLCDQDGLQKDLYDIYYFSTKLI